MRTVSPCSARACARTCRRTGPPETSHGVPNTALWAGQGDPEGVAMVHPTETMTGPRQEQVSLLSSGAATVPVVWVARTSTDDMQAPPLSLPRQLDSVRTPMELRGRGTAHQQF